MARKVVLFAKMSLCGESGGLMLENLENSAVSPPRVKIGTRPQNESNGHFFYIFSF